MLEEFKKYVSNYDLNNEKIKLKYDHSLRVMELSKKYSEILGFNNEDIKLATLIGLLHDFGRFEQLKIYDTYDDSKSIDHADYSVEQLFDLGKIKNYTNDEENYEIIKFAIKNHNKLYIEDTIDNKKLMHAKLIRDTDKIDILFILANYNNLNLNCTNDEVSENVKKSLKKHVSVKHNDIKNENDKICLYFSYVFDINNDICLKEIKTLLEKFYITINGKLKLKEIYDEIINYIDERIEKNVR